MTLRDFIIRVVKRCYRIILNKRFLNPECDCDRQSSNDKIYRLLDSGNPCMISRFGTVEINCINNYLCVNHHSCPFWSRCVDYVVDKTHTPWWNKGHFKPMFINAGIFPLGQDIAERFSQRALQDTPQIDMLACHQYYEKFMPLREGVSKIQLEMLYPFFVERPWTRALKGKRVLVVHPFEATIQEQYTHRRADLFANRDVLPEFELITLKAVQSIGGNRTEFKDWFEALEYMENRVSEIDFDICIIGCGAYGMALAAHVKRLGKQAIHIGGGVQLLFGILGRRWVSQYPKIWHYRPNCDIDINYKPLFNDSWQYPLSEDTPQNIDKIEDGCYWR